MRQGQDGLLGNDATSLSEPEQELLAFIQTNARSGVRTTVKSLLERFERKSYGWYYAAILCNLALLCARGKVEVRQDSNPLEGDLLERSLRNTNAHATLVLEPQIEFSASQVRALKDFFADFFDQPASSNEARALARETIDAIKELEIDLAELHGQKVQYPFLSALDGVLATLKEIAAKNPAWFLTDLSRAEDALLEAKEQVIDPVQRFMKSPQKEIYDQARLLVQEQQENFAYVGTAEVDAIRAVLADAKPWQGNRLQQVRQQLDALQLAIANQLASEQKPVSSCSTIWSSACRALRVTGHSTRRRNSSSAPFAQAKQQLKGQKLIAVIRDQRNRFEDEQYPQLLLKLDQFARPKPVPAEQPSPSTQPENTKTLGADTPEQPTLKVAEPRIVPARHIKVGYSKPWLTSEAELDDYLQKQREAWLKEIQAGNRVQI